MNSYLLGVNKLLAGQALDFEGLVNNNPDIIIRFNRSGVVSYCNLAANKLLATTIDTIVGVHMSDISELAAIYECWLKWFQTTPANRGQAVSVIDISIGQTLSFDIQFISEPGSQDEFFYCIAHDPTQVRLDKLACCKAREPLAKQQHISAALRWQQECERLQQEVFQATIFAEQANKAKSEFLAIVSHEIRTPMNSIAGIIELLCESSLDERQRQYTSMIREASAALITIIDDILDLSKAEAGQFSLGAVLFNVLDVIDQVRSAFINKIQQKGLAFSCSVTPEAQQVFSGDAKRIRQVLLNLIGNAVKFTHQGQVAVLVVLGQSGDHEPFLRFEVRDTGIGIPLNIKNKLFRPFVQADSSFSRGYEGAGLGLALCRRLVALMGGEINYHSDEGYGSTFWFTVPVEYAEQPVGAKVLPVNNTYQDNLEPMWDITASVLLVEDNPVNRELAIMQLNALGITQICVASNGTEAVQLYRQSTYSAILMDCHMPIMDGLTATNFIRRLEKASGRRTPIIAMTAYAMHGDQEHCLAAGMDDYLSKPVKLKRLKEVLSRWLPPS